MNNRDRFIDYFSEVAVMDKLAWPDPSLYPDREYRALISWITDLYLKIMKPFYPIVLPKIFRHCLTC
jgi:hypothetical protein